MSVMLPGEYYNDQFHPYHSNNYHLVIFAVDFDGEEYGWQWSDNTFPGNLISYDHDAMSHLVRDHGYSLTG